jgi:hypothetical protein
MRDLARPRPEETQDSKPKLNRLEDCHRSLARRRFAVKFLPEDSRNAQVLRSDLSLFRFLDRSESGRITATGSELS